MVESNLQGTKPFYTLSFCDKNSSTHVNISKKYVHSVNRCQKWLEYADFMRIMKWRWYVIQQISVPGQGVRSCLPRDEKSKVICCFAFLPTTKRKRVLLRCFCEKHQNSSLNVFSSQSIGVFAPDQVLLKSTLKWYAKKAHSAIIWWSWREKKRLFIDKKKDHVFLLGQWHPTHFCVLVRGEKKIGKTVTRAWCFSHIACTRIAKKKIVRTGKIDLGLSRWRCMDVECFRLAWLSL